MTLPGERGAEDYVWRPLGILALAAPIRYKEISPSKRLISETCVRGLVAGEAFY